MDNAVSTSCISRGEPKRLAIISAAQAAFLDHGYANTSMDGIAAAAGASKRTVYNHFPSKRDLFRAVAARLYAELMDCSPGGLPPEQPPEQVLPVFARQILAHLRRPEVCGLLRLVIAEQHRFPELALDFYAEGKGPAMGLLESYIAAQAAQGRLAVTDAHLAAALFLGAIKEACYWPGLLGLPTADDETAIAQSMRAFLVTFSASA